MPIALHRRWLLLCALAFAAHAQSAGSALPLRPVAVAYDATGNAYFADTDRNQIYEATLGGALQVVAGSGTQGSSGDGGAATAAALNAPQGVAIGPGGELYIADTGNQRIRVVRAGTISAFAGSGTRGFSGDGGPAAAASLSTPTALAVDATGALLLCDTGNQRVRRVSSGVIATIAGNGTQGFAGDGGPATAAELDGPQGVASASDGRVFVADSRNHRIRVIDASGVINTLAGTGVRGYSGDGSAATAAALNLPRGLVLTSSGALVFADSDNRRIRAISPSGVIGTLIGAGTQGASAEGTAGLSAWLNAPRAVAISSFGEITLADAANRNVQIQAPADNVYSAAALVPSRASNIALTGPASAVYGQWAGQVSVTGNASTPLGTVQLIDGTTAVGSASLNAGAASFALSALPVGPHALIATYSGDGINPSATSSALSLTIGRAPLTGTADAASMLYGQAMPALTGSLSGVLPQDAGNVAAMFRTTASALSPVGNYPITASLSGAAAGNYTLNLGPASGELTIAQAPSQTQLPAQATGAVAGAPLVLRAVVSSTTSGTPSGTVNFLEGGATFAQAALTGGIASVNYSATSSGTHTISAVYGGDTNFLSSSSAVQDVVIAAMPDFTISSSGSASQTVVAGSAATYALVVASQSSPFSGVVSMSVSGLPAGAVATFSPPAVVPGTSSAAVTLTITTPVHAQLRLSHPGSVVFYALVLLPLPLLRRRRGAVTCLCVTLAMLAVVSLSGCGTRTVSPASTTGSSTGYNLIVTGTGTNLAGTVVMHSLPLTLTVD